MRLNNKLSAVLIIFLLLLLVGLHFMSTPPDETYRETGDNIIAVGQGQSLAHDLQVNSDNIVLSDAKVHLLQNISFEVPVVNAGTSTVGQVLAVLYLEDVFNGNRTEIAQTTLSGLGPGATEPVKFSWQVPAETRSGEYKLVVNVTDPSGAGAGAVDQAPDDNEGFKSIIIRSILELETKRGFSYPGRQTMIIVTLNNLGDQILNTTLNISYYSVSENRSDSKFLVQRYLEVLPGKAGFCTFNWSTPKDLPLDQYILLVEIVDSTDNSYINMSAEMKLNLIEYPDTSKTPVYLQVWFIVGFISLIVFFLTIILSLIGVIPQDRLPIQPALVVMAMVIMVLALVGNYFDPKVHLIGAQDIAGMVIIHPITALTAGFLVAGGLEASGAFAAAADALGRIEVLKFKGRTIFGFTGTVVILTNIPTLIAMPCGRILGAALMPAALFFGYRVAKTMGDSRMVGVVVFSFIVNAAASCGPSPLGGIGTIGEGMSKMPIGSFTTAQSTGIMICTGVCALFMRFITPMRPADLSDEDIRREKEAEKNEKNAAVDITEGDSKYIKYNKEKDDSKTKKPPDKRG